MADRPIMERAHRWIVGEHVGASSKSIWAHMMGAGAPRGQWSVPHDPDDMSRCLRLLRLIPEWAPRIPEMAARSPQWAKLAPRWDEVVQSMEDEVGWDWSKGRAAPRTYDLMCSIFAARSIPPTSEEG